jgi:hypothetical protein
MGNEGSKGEGGNKSKPTTAVPSKITTLRETPLFKPKDDPEKGDVSVNALKKSQSSDTLQSTQSIASFAETRTRKPRKSLYDEIYEGPTRFGSLLKGMKVHLTVGIDKSYFGGQAGEIRIFTLCLGVVSIGLSLPGFTKTEKLMVGYGEGYSGILAYFSIGTMCFACAISATFIILLLFFKEVISDKL